MRSILSGYTSPTKATEPLIPLIEGWIRATRKYTKIHGGDDAPYYYNERANTSLMAAGAWLRGGVAIEEFNSIKGRGVKQKRGRADLYVCLENYDTSFEAKHRWMLAGHPEATFLKRARQYLSLAVSDVKKVWETRAKVGVVFFVPGWTKTRYPDFYNKNEDYIKAEISRYVRCEYAHQWAWCFPSQSRVDNPEGERAHWPGVITGFRIHKGWH